MAAKKRLLVVILVLLLGSLVTSVALGYWHRHSRLSQLQAIYDAGLRVVPDRHDVFAPEAMLPYCDSLLAAGSDTLRASWWKANALARLGEEQKAIPILEKLAGLGRRQDVQMALQGRDPLKFLALAWLRLGERNNCLRGHNHASCVFPIRGEGVYTDPLATQKAIAIYQQILREDPSDLESRWLLNIGYMTLGQYPGFVPAALLIPGLDKDSAEGLVKPFEEIAMPLGLAEERTMAGGTIVDDFDGDGNLDIVLSSWGWGPEDGMHYYHNNGDGTFSDLAKKAGIAGLKGSLNIQQVDYNNDGLMDIFMLRGGWRAEYGKQPKTLLRNNGDGTFSDVTVESGLVSLHPTQAAVWADFNNDGWPDVFIGQESTSIYNNHPCELWVNNGNGTFTEVAQQAGCGLAGFVKGVASADYNNDNWADLFLSQRDGRKVLFKNKALPGQIPQFENVTHAAGLDKDTTYTFPTWFWDYDNDGWPDIFVCGYRIDGTLAKAEAAAALHVPVPGMSTMYLYHNNHDGTFTNVTVEQGMDKPVFAMGSNFGDIDNDGWLDCYLGTGNPDLESLSPNRLFRNGGGRGFVDVTSAARVGNLQKGHGVAFADLDNDGDQDIFIKMGGAFKGDGYYNSFYLNPGQNGNGWIDLQLEGGNSCRSALGARIATYFTENGQRRVVYRDVGSGGSFGSSPLRQHIGIGAADKIDTLEIRWPASGMVQRFTNVGGRRLLHIKEGEDVFREIALKKLNFKGNMALIDCPPVRK